MDTGDFPCIHLSNDIQLSLKVLSLLDQQCDHAHA